MGPSVFNCGGLTLQSLRNGEGQMISRPRILLFSALVALTLFGWRPSFGLMPWFGKATFDQRLTSPQRPVDDALGSGTEYWRKDAPQVRFWLLENNIDMVNNQPRKGAALTDVEVKKNREVMNTFLSAQYLPELKAVWQVPWDLLNVNGSLTKDPIEVVLFRDHTSGYLGAYSPDSKHLFLNLDRFLKKDGSFNYTEAMITLAHETTHYLLDAVLKWTPFAQQNSNGYTLLNESLAYFVEKMAYPQYVLNTHKANPLGLTALKPMELVNEISQYVYPDIRWDWKTAAQKQRDRVNPSWPQEQDERLDLELASIGYYLARGWHDWGYNLLLNNLPNAKNNEIFKNMARYRYDPLVPFRTFLGVYSSVSTGLPFTYFESAVESAYGRKAQFLESSYWSWIGSGVEKSTDYSKNWYDAWVAGGKLEGPRWTWEFKLWSHHWENLYRVNQQVISYNSQLVARRGYWQGVLGDEYSRNEISEAEFNRRMGQIAFLHTDFQAQGATWWYNTFIPDLNSQTNRAMLIGRAWGDTDNRISMYDKYLSDNHPDDKVKERFDGWRATYEQRLRDTVYQGL
jgi:hypothetical protein